MIKFTDYAIEEDGNHDLRFAIVGHPQIKTVFIFRNSMVVVFGHDGKQIPNMQGALIEALEALAEKRKNGEEIRDE
jgi:hypothetical protein